MAGPISGAARPATRSEQRQPQRQDQDMSFLAVDIDADSPYHVDPSAIPDGMSYEWSRVTYCGKDDPRQQARRQRHRWTSVPNKRHPELVGRIVAESKPDEGVVIDGLALVERPTALTEYVAGQNVERAKAVVRNQARSLRLTPDGTMERVSKGPKIGFGRRARAEQIQVADQETEGDED
jgi:hypothetical protein